MPEEDRPDRQPDWDPRFGDREQQLVFIGRHLDCDGLRQRLDACLLAPSLVDAGSAAWVDMSNPFPPLTVEADDEEAPDPEGAQTDGRG
jgi:hypothetical protein